MATSPIRDANLETRGDALPDAGAYVRGDDGQLYRVISTVGQVQTSPPGRPNWIRAKVELVDWSVCAESDEFPAMACLPDDA